MHQMQRAMEQSENKTGKVQAEDLIFLVRKDPQKFARVNELLKMDKELKDARKAFDVEEAS